MKLHLQVLWLHAVHWRLLGRSIALASLIVVKALQDQQLLDLLESVVAEEAMV